MNNSTHYTTFATPPPADDAPLCDWALWYSRQGWAVFPCYGKVPITRRGFLDATGDETQVRSWWGQWPEANIGLPVPAGQVVLDIDPRNGGSDTLHTLQQLHGALPDTLTSLTGGGGQHLVFTTSRPVKNKARLGDGIDVQAQGSYIIAPPSVHPVTGKPYRWDAAYGPDTLGPQPLPAWLEDLLTRPEPLDAAPRDPQAPIREGQRETTLMAIAGAMQRLGASPEAIRSALETENQRCVPPLDTADLERMTWSVGRYAPAPRLEVNPPTRPPDARPARTAYDIPPDIPLADYFNARELVERHGTDMYYCKAWRDWLVWTGTHWRRNDMGQIEQWAKGTIMSMLERLHTLPDAKARDALYRHIRASLATGRLEAMMKSADNEPDVRIEPTAFDQKLWLLNCPNGTLDLHTGILQPHSRHDLLLKCLHIPYDPEATCPTWERFLWRIMGGSITPDDPNASSAQHEARYEGDQRAKRLIAFLQRAVGYSLTGDIREQCFFMLYGSGRNGKSTFIETIKTMVGPYGKTAEMSTFLVRKEESVRNDLADLHGARFVSASEGDRGKRLSESLVRSITGGDIIKARFLFQELFEFLPQMHVWLAVNDKPVIRSTDMPMWERVKLIPFEVFIPREERDKHLAEKLRAELPGILAWAVKGCREWQRYDSLKEPPEVTHATEAYRQEMDTFGQFLEECCLKNPDIRVKAGVLYKAYQQWCTDNGRQADSMTEMGKRIETMDGVTKKKISVYWYYGLGLYHQEEAS